MTISIVARFAYTFASVTVINTFGILVAKVTWVGLFLTGYSITDETGIALAPEAASSVCTGGIFATVVSVFAGTLVFVVTFVVAVIVTIILADAFAIFAISVVGTFITWVFFFTVPSVTVVAGLTDAHFCWWVSFGDAVGVIAAFFTWVGLFGACFTVSLVTVLTGANSARVGSPTGGVLGTFGTWVDFLAVFAVSAVT